MKAGKVIILGRPNSGKSTLINNLVGKKISIVSIRPETTRKPVEGLYWDERGQIIFVDSPGVFAKIKDPVSLRVSQSANQELVNGDLIIYLIDIGRSRGEEENRILGLVRSINKPKILVFNKIDFKGRNFLHEYRFLEEEFNTTVKISALKRQHLKTLLEEVFELLPEHEPIFDQKLFEAFPALNISPKDFIAEIIREKTFINLQDELPYTINVNVEELREEPNIFYIKADIFTTNKRYRPMIIGAGGKNIKEIGTLARKEIELITGKKVYLDLRVIVNPNWFQEELLT